MRYLFLIIVCFLLFAKAEQTVAQKIHAIVISDTNDVIIGKGCQKNLTRVEKNLTEIAENSNLKLVKYVLSGKNVSDYEINKLIKKVNCEKDDVIFFHYSGHGSNTGFGAWPKLLLKNGGGLELRLDNIHRRLVSKAARLVITLGDCCNLGGKTQNFANTNTAPPALLQTTNEIWKIKHHYARLFQYAKGNILATGTKAGLAAYFNDSLGGYFTISFFEALYQTTHNNDIHKVSWNKILAKSQVFTNETAESLGKQQMPYFTVQMPFDNKTTNEQTIIADNTVRQYEVKKGDNLGKIALFFTTTTDKRITAKQIQNWNGIKDPKNLQVGRILIVYVKK